MEDILPQHHQLVNSWDSFNMVQDYLAGGLSMKEVGKNKQGSTLEKLLDTTPSHQRLWRKCQSLILLKRYGDFKLHWVSKQISPVIASKSTKGFKTRRFFVEFALKIRSTWFYSHVDITSSAVHAARNARNVRFVVSWSRSVCLYTMCRFQSSNPEMKNTFLACLVLF